MVITLVRHSHSEFGTFGTLHVGDKEFCTVEQDWEGNQPNISCVPNGTYVLEAHESPNHGRTYILSNPELNVGKYKGESRRFGCLIHKANLASELRGCIAPGLAYGFYKGAWSVSSSGAALSILLEMLASANQHELVITSAFPSFIE